MHRVYRGFGWGSGEVFAGRVEPLDVAESVGDAGSVGELLVEGFADDL